MFTIVASDGEEIVLADPIAKQFNLIMEMDEGEDKKINVNIHSRHLKHAVKLAELFQEKKPADLVYPIVSSNVSEIMAKADTKFITFLDGLSIDDIKELAWLLNYMDSQPLLRLVCVKIATLAKGEPNDYVCNKLFSL